MNTHLAKFWTFLKASFVGLACIYREFYFVQFAFNYRGNV